MSPCLSWILGPSSLRDSRRLSSFLGADLGGVKLLLETYSANIPATAHK